MRCIAIIMIHNGLPYVDRCLRHLFAQGIEVAILDHGSTDGTYERCMSDLGGGICHLSRVPYDGLFALSDQLRRKHELMEKLEADWIIHQDIDECLEAVSPFEKLPDLMVHADQLGFNALNFDEFVFLPLGLTGIQDCYESRYYYFFQPSVLPRLMRAWKKDGSIISNVETGGHVLSGDVKLFPCPGYLRHYLFVDQEHAYQKYANRQFSDDELAKGWHQRRINITPSTLLFPDKSELECLPHSKSRRFCTSRPWKKHYWQLT